MTSPATSAVDAATAVRRVNGTLKGPVVDVFRQILPELKGMPRADVYDRTLDDLDLLQRCFEAFRRERRQFRYIVTDLRHRPVTDDVSTLSCGRTLAEVVAMVVRSAAKRYFRRTLGGGALTAAGPNVVPLRPAASDCVAADELYEAIKDYLMHEWQVPLVPTYATMSPARVRDIGPRLLDAREVAQLVELIAAPAVGAPPAAAAPVEVSVAAAPVDRIAALLTPDGSRLRVEAFAPALLSPEVRAELPGGGNGVRLSEVLRGVGGSPARLLISGLKLSPEQLAVVALTAHALVGAEVFSRLFGQPGQPGLVLRMVQRALEAGIGPDASLGQCAEFTRQLFARAGGGLTERG